MRLLSVLILLFLSLAAQAQIEFGLLGGLRNNYIDTDVPGATTTERIGLQVGALGFFPIYPTWGVRSGVIYSQRFAYLGRVKQGDVDLNFTYFDVPMTLYTHFSDIFGAFAGPVLGFNQSKEVTCSNPAFPNCAAQDVKSLILPWQAGVSFRFLPQMGGEFYFEYIPGEVATNVLDMKSLGLNLLFYFE